MTRTILRLVLSFCLIAAARESGAAQSANRVAESGADLNPVMQRLEKNMDAFDDKFEAALDKSTLNGSDLEDRLNTWAGFLEDEVDQMAEDYNEKDKAAFNNHVENSLMAATAINRAMLRRDIATAVESDWRTIREDLNRVAMEFQKSPLPNVTVITIGWANKEALGRAEVKQSLDELEDSTDRFIDKFDNAWYTNIAPRRQAELFKTWLRELEDVTDEMAEEYQEKDTREFQEELEIGLILADAINRMVLSSTMSKEPVMEWNNARKHFNTLAGRFGYPVLPETGLRTTAGRK